MRNIYQEVYKRSSVVKIASKFTKKWKYLDKADE